MERASNQMADKGGHPQRFKPASDIHARRSATSPQRESLPVSGSDISVLPLALPEWNSIYRAAFIRYLRTGAPIEVGEVLSKLELKENKLRRAILADLPRVGDHDGDADDVAGALNSGLAAFNASDGTVKEKIRVTTDQLQQIMPHAGSLAGKYVEALNAAMANHGIDSASQIAAFLAQVGVESNDLRNVAENLNYSARRLTEVWPTRFPTFQGAEPYAHNPTALANNVYANRLGNGDEASGDGYRFRGRGLIQITGRSNYEAAGFVNDPDSLSDPTNAANSAASYWQGAGLNNSTNSVLGRGEFNAISRIVNGGSIGSEERWQAYQRGLAALQP